jgi:hypothetical protein|nr:MAG: hypothetical protein KatS3mg041_1367 [Bacteroidota bacterium]
MDVVLTILVSALTLKVLFRLDRVYNPDLL